MLLFCCLIFIFFLIIVSFNLVFLNKSQSLILVLEVVEDCPRYPLASLCQTLTSHAQLTDAIDLEFFNLAVHVSKEDWEVFWDFLVADEMLGILSCVELADELTASGINLRDCLRESLVFLAFLDVSDRSKVSNLSFYALSIKLILAFLEVKFCNRLKLGDTLKIVRALGISAGRFEAT